MRAAPGTLPNLKPSFMANIKSSKKDIRRSAERRVKNTAVKSAIKTYVKKVRSAIATDAEAQGPEALRLAMKALDKAAQNGTIHKNQASRRKSRLAKQLAVATATPETILAASSAPEPA